MTFIQITQELEDRIVWLYDISDFETPDALIEALRSAADPNNYRISGYNIWATPDAIDAAIAMAEQWAAEEEDRWNF